MDLKEGWKGAEIFGDAFQRLFPRKYPPTMPYTPAAPDYFAPKQPSRHKKHRIGKVDYRTLTVVSHLNPYRYGTKAWKTFRLFKENSGKKVYEIKALATEEHDLGYLNYSSRDGYITLT
jgi:hypothetical protein